MSSSHRGEIRDPPYTTARRARYAAIACIFLGATVGPTRIEAARPKKAAATPANPRLVWAGLVPGPLSPKRARALEQQLIELLSNELQLPLVDAGGRPLGHAAEVLIRSEHERTYDLGIAALLHQDYDLALTELERAAEIFEQRLAGLRDHRPLYRTLIAKAAVLLETGRKEAAREVLRQLAALQPKEEAPTSNTQSEKLVSLYQAASRELGAPALLRFEGDSSEAHVRLDGRDLGAPPFAPIKLAPGRHLVFVQAQGVQRVEIVTLEPRSEKSIRVTGEPREERQRKAFLEDVTFRPAQVASSGQKLVKLSGAPILLVAWAKREAGRTNLHLARLDARGQVENVVRGPLEEPPGPTLRALVEAAADPKRRGGFQVEQSGELLPSARLADALGGRAPR